MVARLGGRPTVCDGESAGAAAPLHPAVRPDDMAHVSPDRSPVRREVRFLGRRDTQSRPGHRLDERHLDRPRRAVECGPGGRGVRRSARRVRGTVEGSAVVAGGGRLRRPGAAFEVPRRVSVCRRRPLPADVFRAPPVASYALALRGRDGCRGDVPARDRVERAARVGVVCISGRQGAAAGYRPLGAARRARRTGHIPAALAMAAAGRLSRQGARQGSGRRSPLDDGLPGDRPDRCVHGSFPHRRSHFLSLGGSGISHALPAAGRRGCRGRRDPKPLRAGVADRDRSVVGRRARCRRGNELSPLAHDRRAERENRSLSAAGERRLDGSSGPSSRRAVWRAGR